MVFRSYYHIPGKDRIEYSDIISVKAFFDAHPSPIGQNGVRAPSRHIVIRNVVVFREEIASRGIQKAWYCSEILSERRIGRQHTSNLHINMSSHGRRLKVLNEILSSRKSEGIEDIFL